MARTTIVVPCFNEEQRLDVPAFQAFAGSAPDVRLLFVNDGSRDRTLDVLERVCQAAPERWAILDLERNSGKAEAVRRGLCQALSSGAEYVGFWDADLATPLAEIDMFRRALDAHPGVDLVVGARIPLLGHAIERHPLRYVLSRAFARTASLVLGVRLFDTQCGAKLFRASADLSCVLAQPFATRWIFDVELMARYHCLRRETGPTLAQTLYEVPLDAWRDVAGSKLKSSDFRKAIRELGLIYWRYLRRGAAEWTRGPYLESAPGSATGGGSAMPAGQPEPLGEPRRRAA